MASHKQDEPVLRLDDTGKFIDFIDDISFASLVINEKLVMDILGLYTVADC